MLSLGLPVDCGCFRAGLLLLVLMLGMANVALFLLGGPVASDIT